VNQDAIPLKGRANPLMGYNNVIPVTGDSCESYYNMFVVISGNPAKSHPIQYQIDQENSTASTFRVWFITALISSVFLKHEEALV
jgi:hypothetical protein